jgi:uncharacterized membrane protein (UPF0182 family)
MNPVNEATSDGQPVFWMRDLPPQTPEYLPLKNPAVYFGENIDRYSIVRTQLQEFDYPRLTARRARRMSTRLTAAMGACRLAAG